MTELLDRIDDPAPDAAPELVPDVATTLIVACAIPISLLATFVVLNLTGRTLNIISLAGLACLDRPHTGLARPFILGALAGALALADELAAFAPLALGMAKTVLNTCTDVDHETGRRLERIGQSVLKTTEDHAEGAQAFIEKRKPVWQGR